MAGTNPIKVKRRDLAGVLATELNLPKDQALRGVELLLGAIATSLANGSQVDLSGFGRFSIVIHPARQGRNPKTGAMEDRLSYRRVVFSSGGRLRRLVKGE